MIRRIGLHLAVITSYLLIALVQLRPLASVLSSAMQRGTREDTLLHAWILNWTARQLVRDPLKLFDSNAFFPFPNSLAYTEHLVPEALPAIPVQALTGDPILTYNLAFLFTFVFCGWGTFLLTRRLTGNVAAAWVAGAFGCWFPAKRWSLAHINTISVQWVPFALLALDRLMERPRAWLVGAAALAVALASLSSAYYTVYFPLLLVIAVPAFGWARGYPLEPKRVGAVVAAGVLAALLAAPVLGTYWTLYSAEKGDYEYVHGPGAGADVAELFLLDSWVWAPVLESRTSVKSTAGLFPGVIALALAALALLPRSSRGAPVRAFWRSLSSVRRLVYLAGWVVLGGGALLLLIHLDAHFRAWIVDAPPPPAALPAILVAAALGILLLASVERGRFPLLPRALWWRLAGAPPTVRVFGALTAIALVIALGQQLQFFGYLSFRLPLYWLYRWVPVFGSLRAPFRVAYIGMMFFAVLVGYGAARLLPQLERWRIGAFGGAVLLVAAMQLEYLGPPLPPAPPPASRVVDAWLAEEPGDFGIFELPQPEKLWQTAREQWRSVHHWKRRVTGHNGFVPSDVAAIHRIASPVLREDFLELLLRDFPIRYLLLDLDALSNERREWALDERLPELADVLVPVQRFGSDLVLEVRNGGLLGPIRRRFPRWMIDGVLQVELAEPFADPGRARLMARFGETALEPVRLRAGDRTVQFALPEALPDGDLLWLSLRLAPQGAAPLRVNRIRFLHPDGNVYP